MDVPQTLGGFLQSRRARVAPQSAGLRGGGRRRVPGLRREELAQLAGISVEYYQRLEQGRAVRPSDAVLDALARELGLDRAERNHLRALAHPRRECASESPPAASRIRPELQRVLALMDRVPALVVNDRFDVLAANALALRLFVGIATVEPAARNLARYLFLDPEARDFYVEWDEVAAATAAQLGLAEGLRPGDRELAALIAELSAGSTEFRGFRDTGDVEQRSHGTKTFRHPAVGVLDLHYENLDLVGDPGRRLVTFSPRADGAAEAGLQLLRSWTSPDPAVLPGAEEAADLMIDEVGRG
ncbi:helix-turn-helix transcriptional regulator [Embleya hyalina]|uniref:Transcriptional regulator n=1 Tax=Embleya hyalina TaxID=516124 RepID=A0A401YQH5_9ACTN|nr:helix-turn-helix transcriptional regulator [Embleya hyalina]GCD96858.1 transcriptional regulator [Embleya hyalina]